MVLPMIMLTDLLTVFTMVPIMARVQLMLLATMVLTMAILISLQDTMVLMINHFMQDSAKEPTVLMADLKVVTLHVHLVHLPLIFATQYSQITVQ